MGNKHYYEKGKARILQDPTICTENRNLFREFFAYEEYKLKRINGLDALDEGTYKTLLEYCSRFRTVNKWFKNKPWTTLTEADIKRVYDDLEDGKIKNQSGRPFKNKTTYYTKIMKSKPFDLAGKATIAKKVINAFARGKADSEVRYIEEEDFQKLVDVVIRPVHKLLFWLAWDIGENVNSLLQLTKADFYRQTNEETHETEYRVNLTKAVLKRSRRPRGEITNFAETVKLADHILQDLRDREPVFTFQYRQAKKVFDRASLLTGVKCKPGNQEPTWKDLRSGMACHLLKSGWHTDEINARLGHQPSSKELDKYVNFLAMDGRKPKKKLYENNLHKISRELEESRQREKLYALRVDNQGSDLDSLKTQLAERDQDITALMKWKAEAAKRGVAEQSMADALAQALKNPKVCKMIATELARQGLHVAFEKPSSSQH